MASQSILDQILGSTNLYGEPRMSAMPPQKPKPRSPMSNAPMQSFPPKKELMELLGIKKESPKYEGGQSIDPLMMLSNKPALQPEIMSKPPVYHGGQSYDILQQLLKKPEVPPQMTSGSEPPRDNYVMAERPPQREMTPAEKQVLGGNTVEEIRQQYVKDQTTNPMTVLTEEPQVEAEVQQKPPVKISQQADNTVPMQTGNMSGGPVSMDGNQIRGATENFDYNLPSMGTVWDRASEVSDERKIYADYLSKFTADDRTDLSPMIDFANAMNRTGKKIGQNYRAPTSGVVESDKLSSYGDRMEKIYNDQADREQKIANAVDDNQVKREKMLSDELVAYTLANQKSSDALSNNMFGFAKAKMLMDGKRSAPRAGKGLDDRDRKDLMAYSKSVNEPSRLKEMGTFKTVINGVDKVAGMILEGKPLRLKGESDAQAIERLELNSVSYGRVNEVFDAFNSTVKPNMQGGTTHSFDNIAPKTLAGKLGKFKEWFKGNPQPANQGEHLYAALKTLLEVEKPLAVNKAEELRQRLRAPYREAIARNPQDWAAVDGEDLSGNQLREDPNSKLQREGRGESTGMLPPDPEKLAWAKRNPLNVAAQKYLRIHGGK